MTISTTATSVSYTGNGSTTVFAVNFAFFDADELEVIERVIATGVETVKTLTTHYTVSGGDGSTGSVTAVSAPAATVQWHIRRKTDKTQATDYVANDSFPAETHERALDRLTAQTQEVAADVGRAIVAPKTDTAPQLVLPADVTRANKALIFDANGDVAVSTDDYEDQLADVTAQADAAAASASDASDDADAAAASASAASSSASAASSSASAASTSASNASTSASAASDSADAAAASAASITGDVADAEAAQVAAEAAQTAAEAAQTAAELAETNAETAETNAGTSATNAATSATNASNSATAASGSATTASSAATAAQTAQTAAELAETNAETAETNAETAQTAAELAQTRAENATGIAYNFDSSTTAADPGAGDFRLNNATLASVTAIYIDNADANGNTMSAWLDAFDDSNNSAGKGLLTIKGTDTPTAFFIGRVTAVADSTGYRTVTVEHVASGGTFTNAERFVLGFAATGEAGLDGEGSGDVVGPASATNNALAQWDGTTGKLLKDGPATSSFATSAQGALADSALQPADIGSSVQAYDAQLDTWATVTPSANGQSLVAAANYAAMRTLLDLEAGTDFYSVSGANAAFQPLDSDLTAIAALANTDGNFIVGNGSAWVVESGATARTSMGAAALGANTFTGEQNLADQGLTRPYVKDYAEVLATASVSGSVTVNLENGNVHALTMTGNITSLTISNWPATGRHGKLTLYLIHSGGARTVTWPAAVKWGAAGAPTLSASGDTDVITLTTRDAGTTIFGFANGLDFA